MGKSRSQTRGVSIVSYKAESHIRHDELSNTRQSDLHSYFGGQSARNRTRTPISRDRTSKKIPSRTSNCATSRKKITTTPQLSRETSKLSFTQILQKNASALSFDPVKKTLIQHHMTHKGRVSSLQAQVSEQKFIIKRHLNEKVQQLRTKVIKSKKNVSLLQNDNVCRFQKIKGLKSQT